MSTSLCAATGKTVVASRTAESLIVFFTKFPPSCYEPPTEDD